MFRFKTGSQNDYDRVFVLQLIREISFKIISSKKFGTENILIGKNTSVELIDKPDDFDPTIIDSNSVLSIAQLNKISSNQIISVEATVERM